VLASCPGTALHHGKEASAALLSQLAVGQGMCGPAKTHLLEHISLAAAQGTQSPAVPQAEIMLRAI